MNQIKQPEPTLTDASTAQVKRPNVGVLTVPKISSTPIADAFFKKRQENPKPKITVESSKAQGYKVQNAMSLGIGACAILAIFKEIKSFKKFLRKHR